MRTRNHRITTRVDWPGRTQANQPVPLEGGQGNGNGGGGGAPDPHAPTHASGGSDPVDVTGLDGYPGGTATFLRADGSFAAPPVGGTPGGATTQVQFNDGGTFGGDTELTFDKTTGSLIVGRMLNINSSVIRKSTADGADNQYVVLCGGGGESPARGALFYVLGNEYGSGQSGNVEFYLGNVAGSTFKVKNAGGSDVVIVDGATGRLGLSMVPDARLCIRQSGNGAGGGLRVVRSDAATYGELYMGSDDALYLQNNGLGYISLASTGATFISGSLTTWGGILPATDNAATCGGSGKRWSAVWAANGTIQTSDRRHKRDIAASDGLAFVNQLRPVRYRWRDGAEADRVQHGLIAQDLIALGATDYVHGNDAEGYGLNYSSFVAPLIAAVQELSRRLAALERTTDGAL